MKSVTRRASVSSGRRWSTLALTVIASLALFATACGSDDDATSEPEATTTTQAPPASEPTPTTTAAPSGGDGGESSSGEGGGTGEGESVGTEKGGEEASGEDSAPECEPYQDPRGGIFQEFQNEFNRCHPFQSLDAFCLPHDVPDVERVATDDGITADSISIVHLRTQLEDLASFGFFTPVGDPTKMFETYVWYVNNVCGGVNGRMLDLGLVEVPGNAPELDALRNAACIEATEDRNAVIVLNSSGFQGSASLCLVEDHYSAFISTQGQRQEWVDRGEGRLVTLSPTLDESGRFLIQRLLETGELEGKTIGVVVPDTPGIQEAAQAGLVDTLEEAGFEVAVFDVIGCGGGSTCTEGMSESVNNMIDEDVEVLFPGLNVISLPQYLAEMVLQGFEPGDITFYNSDFNSQAGNLVTSKIVQFGQAPAGELYNGTIIVDDADTAAFMRPDYEETPFTKMCHDTYVEYHENAPGNEELDDPPHDPRDPAQNSPYGMVATVCTEMRIALRAIYDAGPNPTRESIFSALEKLGAIDSNNMLPFSIRPGKPQASDAVHTTRFSYPCEAEDRFATEFGTCIVDIENDEWILVER